MARRKSPPPSRKRTVPTIPTHAGSKAPERGSRLATRKIKINTGINRENHTQSHFSVPFFKKARCTRIDWAQESEVGEDPRGLCETVEVRHGILAAVTKRCETSGLKTATAIDAT